MSWSPKRVLYVTEEPKRVWDYRLARLEEWASGTILYALGLPAQRILHEIRAADEAIVVIDTVRLLGLKDENDNSHVAAQLFPVIAACRSTGKTLILVHHMRKGGGDNGEGITGGHAFMGAVDVALEIRRDKRPNRRLVKAYGRADVGGEFLYEKRADGLMVPFGKPSEVTLDEVAQRAIAVLDSVESMATREVLERMPPPRPSGEQLRLALTQAARSGSIVRDPPLDIDARGKTHRWRLAAGDGSED
jgi:predicted ATP-dependent serine protease